MSTLKVNKLRDTAGSADAITLDPNGGAVLAGVTTVSTVKVGSGVTISSDGDVFTTGITTSSTVIVGSGVTITESGIEASGIGITCANINGAQIAGRRNMIINGAMQVAQRGTTSTDSGYKTIDRWDTTKSGMDQLAFTQKQVSDSPNEGYSYSYEIDITTAETAQAGDEYMRVQHIIEAQNMQHLAYGTSSAKSTTLSFWVKAKQTGTYAVNFYSSDGSRHISRTYTISAEATWEHKTVTIPGDTSGTINNDTGSGIHLAFILIADSGYVSSDSTSWGSYTDAGYAYGHNVNMGSSSDNYWKITGVQWEVGTQATAFEHRSFGEELSLCQRYFYMHANGEFNLSSTDRCPIGMGYGYTSTDGYVFVTFPTKMRSNPSLYKVVGTDYFNFAYSNNNGYPNDISANRMSNQVAELNFHTGSSWDQNASGMFRTYNTAARIGFDAELS